MEQFWFVVEARKLTKEFKSDTNFFAEPTRYLKNSLAVPASGNCREFPLPYGKVSGDSYELKPQNRAKPLSNSEKYSN